jgi:NAD(P)-dependent dehydrogenase (short-subunit alcohol dehydrogenase family)
MSNNSIVLITGGNTGIGYETVKALYASPEAHTIIMGSRSLDKAAEAISTLKSEIPESKSEIVPVQIDIESDASMEAAFKTVESQFGRIDALVNNAGKPKLPHPPLYNLTEEIVTYTNAQAAPSTPSSATTPRSPLSAPSGTAPTRSTSHPPKS